jgi:hypothetical protein
MLVVIDNAKLVDCKITLNGGCTQGDGQFSFIGKQLSPVLVFTHSSRRCAVFFTATHSPTTSAEAPEQILISFKIQKWSLKSNQ